MNDLRISTLAGFVARTRGRRNFSFRRAIRRPSQGVSPWLFVGLAILITARRAEAERAITVDAAGAPFAASELVTAIRVRVPAEGPSIEIRVTVTARGVRIEAAGGAREIDVLGLRGAAAARLVALAADDLLPDDQLAVTAIAPAAPSPGRRPREPRDPVTLGVLGAVSSWSGTLGDLALDIAIPYDRWLVAIEVGGGQLMNSALNLTAAIARVDVGAHYRMLEARVGLTAAPVIVSNGAGDQTVLLGANLSLRARLPLARTLSGVLVLGCDAFATRTTYQLDSTATIATPRLAPWLAAGLEVEL